ncbi:MAG TPA: aminoglycoside phosphotransferase family protein [Candidatus Sulfomarinibacteraceae bacterium]|nr:aminoglycoside phosphotransferase family protein [Candidatus Sulfomarinibacteraceae bacterium]
MAGNEGGSRAATIENMELPAPFRQTIIDLYAEDGARWLEQLPDLLRRCAQRWSLTLFPPFADLSYNYVAPARRADGTDVVLKVGVPNPELRTELEALQFYDGRGCVRLLDADWDLGALLLERLTPGAMLVTRDDEEATTIAAGVMQDLWRPLPQEHPFPTVEKWGQGLHRLRRHFDGGDGPFPLRLVERAERYFSELLASSDPPVLLHGDLHHYNILAAERRPWLALDPKGVAGEPAYEPGALLRNPLPQIARVPQLDRVMQRRVAQLGDLLTLDRRRILRWALAQAVLSAWWSFEDSGRGWEPHLAVARALAQAEQRL